MGRPERTHATNRLHHSRGVVFTAPEGAFSMQSTARWTTSGQTAPAGGTKALTQKLERG
jgi:hypothetical protein